MKKLVFLFVAFAAVSFRVLAETKQLTVKLHLIQIQ